MEVLNILIALIIIFVFYKLITHINKENDEPYENDIYDDDYDYEIKNPKKYMNNVMKPKNKYIINPYYVEMQFNEDFRDVINAFNNIVPSQKQIFNKSDLPVKSINTDVSEVQTLIINFINEVNKNIKNEVKTEVSLNGWFDALPQKQITSGWDKQQIALGLPTSLYNDPQVFNKKPIKLLKIDKIEKFETDNEIQYVLYLIIGKKNNKDGDQMIVRVSIVIDKNDINLDRDFFKESKDIYETLVKIEEIFIIGYLTLNSHGSSSTRQDFYQFETAQTDGITDDKTIMKALIKKKKHYMNDYGKKCNIENSYTQQVWPSE